MNKDFTEGFRETKERYHFPISDISISEWLDPQAVALYSRWAFPVWWQCCHRAPPLHSTSSMCHICKDNAAQWALHHVFCRLVAVQRMTNPQNHSFIPFSEVVCRTCFWTEKNVQPFDLGEILRV